MSNVAYAALALVLVSLSLLGAGMVADEGAARTGERTNISEEFTPSVGVVQLDNSNIDELTYSDEVVVVNQGGNHSVQGVDYLWHQGNGTIEVLAGGNLDGDQSATIDYTIWNPTAQDEELQAVFVTLIDTGQWIPLLLLVALVVMAISVLGGLS